MKKTRQNYKGQIWVIDIRKGKSIPVQITQKEYESQFPLEKGCLHWESDGLYADDSLIGPMFPTEISAKQFLKALGG